MVTLGIHTKPNNMLLTREKEKYCLMCFETVGGGGLKKEKYNKTQVNVIV